jgi:hypothetical protein
MGSVNQYFENGVCKFPELSAYFDGLDQDARIKEALSLNASQQKMLWEGAKGSEKLDLDYFVPPNVEPLKEVVHWGKNSLPVFSLFKKVMCRASNSSAVGGYNVASTGWLVGNGYFVTRETSEGEADNQGVVVDYLQAPTEKVEGWPKIKMCDEKLGRFVYAGNYDYMRRVSKHVSIGRAKKAKAPNDKWMPNWFVLCRED